MDTSPPLFKLDLWISSVNKPGAFGFKQTNERDDDDIYIYVFSNENQKGSTIFKIFCIMIFVI